MRARSEAQPWYTCPDQGRPLQACSERVQLEDLNLPVPSPGFSVRVWTGLRLQHISLVCGRVPPGLEVCLRSQGVEAPVASRSLRVLAGRVTRIQQTCPAIDRHLPVE